jgi:hypothetical protein
MKKIIAFTLLALFNNIAYSQGEEVASEEAPNGHVQNLLIECKQYATQDEITEENLNSYLLQCINEELENSFYKKITTLPTQE